MEGFEKLERRKARGEISQKDVEGMLAGCVVCALMLIQISLLNSGLQVKALTTGVANARPIGMVSLCNAQYPLVPIISAT